MENTTGVKEQKEINFSGKIKAVQSADLVSKVPGKVDRVHVDIGSEVKAGQVLVSLSADDLAANVEAAAAAVEKAQVEYELAQQNYQRGKELFANNAISEAAYQNQYEGPFKRAQVGLKTAEAGLKKAKAAYEDMFLKAPFAGVITARNINPGEMASQQQALVTLVNLDRVVVEGSVDEYQVNKLKTGQVAKIKVPAIPGKIFEGKVTNIALAADPGTKSYTVKVQVDNRDRQLKPGMFAEVHIDNK
ncbi:MAG: efflux RND transporter periplasmic adaptor subunit [Desulfotomaculum sp.]|nr:efflux RND transporter periplasmic adaptor subunit [Desulfotomaculum sp.]